MSKISHKIKMQAEQELKYLLEKYSRGKCGPDEIRLLETWFLKTGINISQDLSDSDVARMLDGLKQSPRFKTDLLVSANPKSFTWKPLIAAASIIGLVIFSWMFIKLKLNPKTDAGSYITIQTGQGEVKKILLPDSSVIWLNACTKLAYREGFKFNRSIRLSGEATFHVKKDKSHPFVIYTADGLETRVLGTKFNIRSYEQSGETEIAVLSGNVSVGKVTEKPQRILGKNETLLFNSNKNNWVHEHFPYSIKWIEGQWELKGQGLKALELLLNNQYGIQVRSGKGLPEAMEISANFHKGQQASEIIITFCMLANCNYRWVDGKTIELY